MDRTQPLKYADVSAAVSAAVYEPGSWLGARTVPLDPHHLSLPGYEQQQKWRDSDWKTLLQVLRNEYGVDLDIALLNGIEAYPQVRPRRFTPTKGNNPDHPFEFVVRYVEESPARILVEVVMSEATASV